MSRSMLKETFKARSQGKVLLPVLEKYAREINPDADRPHKVLHPSAMSKSTWCARKDFYTITEAVPVAQSKLTLRQRRTFDWGHTVHRDYQQMLYRMGVLYGEFVCIACGERFSGLSPECVSHGKRHMEYLEVPVVDEDLLLGGNADGIVCVGGKWYLIEIKTVGLGTVRYDAPGLWDKYTEEQLTPDELWYKIRRPFKAHVAQATFYLDTLQRGSYFPHKLEGILFLYEWKPTNATQEFFVPLQEGLAETLRSQAAYVAESVSSGLPPDRPEWAESGNAVCFSCEARDVCWNGGSDESGKGEAVEIRKVSARERRSFVRGAKA